MQRILCFHIYKVFIQQHTKKTTRFSQVAGYNLICVWCIGGFYFTFLIYHSMHDEWLMAGSQERVRMSPDGASSIRTLCNGDERFFGRIPPANVIHGHVCGSRNGEHSEDWRLC